jgi:hypothetical protein
MTTCVAGALGPHVEPKRHFSTVPSICLVVPISATGINGSTWPPHMPPRCVAQSRSPRAGTAAQIP